MKELIKSLPIIGPTLSWIRRQIDPPIPFHNSTDYWKERYARGGNSGSGSYDNLAEFKAEVLNDFVKKHNIQSVIELGSGDGNQLKYFDFPSYLGFDVSPDALRLCEQKFEGDSSKQFLAMEDLDGQSADLVLSLDVIYHLIEEEVYEDYMQRLSDAAVRYLIIYAHDDDSDDDHEPHVKPRKFTRWMSENRPDFRLIEHIPNKYPMDPKDPEHTSFADFYIYEKV